MSVAIVVNNASPYPVSGPWLKGQLTALVTNEARIVRNFKTSDDTFDLLAGDYRIDLVSIGGMRVYLQNRQNLRRRTQLALFNESTNEQIATGIGQNNRYDTSAFLLGVSSIDGEYFVGTGTSSSTADTITFTNHQLAAGDQIFFFGSVPGGIAEGSPYFVSFSGVPAADVANKFKVTTALGGSTVDITSITTPGIYKYFLLDGVTNKIDQRATVARYKITVPVNNVYTISVRSASTDLFGSPHGVTALLGSATVPSRYLMIRLTKTI